MQKITIKSLPAPGFDGRFRAGRYWSATGIQCVAIDSDEDGPDGPDGPQLGRISIAAIRADSRMVIDSFAAVDDIAILRARLAELEAAEAEKKSAEAEEPKAPAVEPEKPTNKKR